MTFLESARAGLIVGRYGSASFKGSFKGLFVAG